MNYNGYDMFLAMPTSVLVDYIRENGQDWCLKWSYLSACVALCCRAQVFEKHYPDTDPLTRHMKMLKDAAKQLGFDYNDLFERKEN